MEHLLTNKNISKTLNVMVLLVVLILSTQATVYALTITIDGSESDWMPSNWICPGGTGCNITRMSVNSVWLCCDQYPNPTKCQLMWRDRSGDAPEVIDVAYVRFYADSSGLYLYIVNANPFRNQLAVVNFCGQTTTINIASPSGVTLATTSRGKDDFALEMKIPLAVTHAGFCVFGTSLVQGGSTEYPEIITVTGTRTTTITTVSLTLSGGHIVGGFYDSIPIPVPEPWYISLVVLVSTVLLFFAKKVKA